MLEPLRHTLARVRPSARHYLVGSALMGLAHAVTWTLFVRYLDAVGYSTGKAVRPRR